MLDSNIVAVSLPAIGRSLGATFTDVQRVNSAYVLTYATRCPTLLITRARAEFFGSCGGETDAYADRFIERAR
jgi:hypothetical protein